jgi:hypothetical protein
MTSLPAHINPNLHSEIAQLARAYRRASGPIMALMQRFGGSLESQMAQLPAPVRRQIESAIVRALTGAHNLAAQAENRIENQIDLGRRNTLIAAMATGAAGGAGGLASALIEMPITITILLHAIRSEARAAGFDPDTPGIRAACLEVFSDASPLREDDGMNTAFISARLAINGAALQKIIATIAPRLALVFGQKLSMQAVPILGAAAGASINAAYLSYYREIARIRFALMRLAIAHGGEAVATAFTRAASQPTLKAK